ncbi:hypothetical protein FRB90_005616 [Tulasnella sp. 427]|nr:hypothetical protein FRB90_005616 [Tulasnella sp. 427]
MSSNPTKTKSPTQVDAPGSKRHCKPPSRARDDDIEGDGVIERAAFSDSESEPSDEGDTASEDDNDNDAEEAPGDPTGAAPETSSISLTAPTIPTPKTDGTSPPDKPAEDTSAVAAVAEPPKEVPQLCGQGRGPPVIDSAELSTVSPGESVTTLLDKTEQGKKKKEAKGDQDSTRKQGGPSASASGGPSAPPAPALGDTPATGKPSTSSIAEPPTDSPAPPTPSSSKPPKHVPAYFTTRQSYLKKLNSGPAATPKVGQLYGHDDRLMDKELRPLSDWWRGRPERGRGGYGGRGRGGRGSPPFAGAQPAEPAPEQLEERPADPIEEKWTHDAFEEHEKQVSARERGRRGTSRGRGRGGPGGRGGWNGIASPTPSSPNSGVTVAQAQLQAQAAAKIAERQDAGPSTPASSNSGRSTGKKPKRAVKNPRAKVSDVLAQAVKERETEKGKGVVAVAKSEVAAAGQQAGTLNVSSASVANTAPTANEAPVQVKLPGSAAQTGHQHRSTAPPTADPLTTTLRQGVQPRPSPGTTVAGQHKRSEALERAVLKESFTKATSSAGASDAVAPPPATQPSITVNAPLVTQSSTDLGYSNVALPSGIAMGESGLSFEIATGQPVVLNPQVTAPPAPTPPLPHPTMSSGGPVYNPRPVPHSHVSRPGSMAYIPPHVLNSGVSSGTPDSSSATPPSFPGYPGSPPAQSQPQTTVVPQLTYAPQPQYPASTTHISEAAQAAAYAAPPPPPPPDQYYNSGYYATPGVNPSGYSGVPTVIGGQTFYNQAYYPQPYGYGPGAEYGYGPPPVPDESYGAYARQQIAGDPNQLQQQQQQQQQQMQQAHGASQGYPPIQAAYY